MKAAGPRQLILLSIFLAWAASGSAFCGSGLYSSPVPARQLRRPVRVGRGLLSGPSMKADFACDSLPKSAKLPLLVVLDLDATLWTPELYQLRNLPGYKDASGAGPVADKDVVLFEGAKLAIEEVATADRWGGSKMAVASRTNKGPWAHSLMKQFRVAGLSLDELMPFKEIYSSSKTKHFKALREQTGIEYEDMLFLDDAKGGKWGNCEPVAKMGVMSAHCPDGLTSEVWRNAIEEFAAAKASGGGKRMGRVIDAPGSGGDGPQTAQIISWMPEKSFGFVRLNSDKSEVFFHKSALGSGVRPDRGTKVVVTLGKGNNGKLACTQVAAADGSKAGSAGGSSEARSGGETVAVDCFSMNQPFAGLVAHGFKTLETRNSTVFKKLEGKWVCLHVGQRTYPDGGMHRVIMQRPGGVDTEGELDRLTNLPIGFSKGHVVAILEIGETELLEQQSDREAPEVELSAVATGAAMGKYLTTVKSATWLEPPGLEMRGFPGVSTIELPVNLIPQGIRSSVIQDVKGGQAARGAGGGGGNQATQRAAFARPSR